MKFSFGWPKRFCQILWRGFSCCCRCKCRCSMRRPLKYVWERLQALTGEIGREMGILALMLVVNRNLHPMERFLWLVAVLGAIYGVTRLSNEQFNRYKTSPTVVSVDRDYRGWKGYLPGVTLCYHDHIDTFRANEYIENIWNVSIVHEDYFYFMEFLYAVLNATAANYADLARFAEDERFDDVDLYELVRSVDRSFEQVFASFDADFEVEVRSVMTERGSCYIINSPVAKILNGTVYEYNELKPPLRCHFGKQTCFIKMDLYEGTGTIDVHSPFEVSSTDSSVIALHKSYEIIASYKVIETVASKNLRELTREQRKCVFHDEETSHLKVYSKTLCLSRCRAIMALEMCNCVPFFYQFVEGPRCNPAGFECLLDFKWPIWALHICKCPSTCTEIEYTVQTVKKSSWGLKANEEGLKTDVATSSFRWDLIPPKVRMRRDVVFSFEDLLVSFGGALALFLGVSLLSTMHLAYACILYVLRNLLAIYLAIYHYAQRQLIRWMVRRRTRIAPTKKRNGGVMPSLKKQSSSLELQPKISRKSKWNFTENRDNEDDNDNENVEPCEFEYVN